MPARFLGDGVGGQPRPEGGLFQAALFEIGGGAPEAGLGIARGLGRRHAARLLLGHAADIPGMNGVTRNTTRRVADQDVKSALHIADSAPPRQPFTPTTTWRLTRTGSWPGSAAAPWPAGAG